MNNNYNLDFSNMQKELILLLEIIKLDNNSEYEGFKKESFTDIDWELFLQLANQHRLYPILYSKVKEIDGVPSYVVQTLHKQYIKNTFQMLTLSGEMEQVSKLFTDNQIPLLFLKGPVVAADLYGDISLRTSRDLDVLIPITHFERTDKLLLNLGYEKEPVLSVLNDWKWRDHHIVYFHPKKCIMLEIHWRLERFPSKEPTFHELWERRRVSKITNYPVHFLGEEDLFVYLVSHGARHGWFRLRWLLDIDQMIRKGINEEKAIYFLKKDRKTHLGGQALILVSELLKTPVKGALNVLTERRNSKRLAKHATEFINGMNSTVPSLSTQSFKFYSYSLKRSQFFLKFFTLLYPSYLDTQTLPLPKSLHFLYFPLRPFLTAARKIRKLSPKQGDL